jgi:hypothetical protein
MKTIVATLLALALLALACYDAKRPPEWPGDPTAPWTPPAMKLHPADGGSDR